MRCDSCRIGYQAQSEEPFYIRDGRISYVQPNAKPPSDGQVATRDVVMLSFLQVFPDNGECKWSAQVEVGPPATEAMAVVDKAAAKNTGVTGATVSHVSALALRGVWSRSGGHLGKTVRHGTFEASRCTDQHQSQGDRDGINTSGETNTSLEQSSLSSFSSNGSTTAASVYEMRDQMELSSDSDKLAAMITSEAAMSSTCHGVGIGGEHGTDESADELSSVSMETVLASLAKVKETLVQGQQQQ